jgi:hypothetical protein
MSHTVISPHTIARPGRRGSRRVGRLRFGIYPDRLVGLVLNQDNRVADEWTLQP